MVVDNDTGKEVKTIFKRVVPQVLQKNKVSEAENRKESRVVCLLRCMTFCVCF